MEHDLQAFFVFGSFLRGLRGGLAAPVPPRTWYHIVRCSNVLNDHLGVYSKCIAATWCFDMFLSTALVSVTTNASVVDSAYYIVPPWTRRWCWSINRITCCLINSMAAVYWYILGTSHHIPGSCYLLPIRTPGILKRGITWCLVLDSMAAACIHGTYQGRRPRWLGTAGGPRAYQDQFRGFKSP